MRTQPSVDAVANSGSSPGRGGSILKSGLRGEKFVDDLVRLPRGSSEQTE